MMKLGHWADLKYLSELAAKHASNSIERTAEYDAHCKKFHDGGACTEAFNAITGKSY